MKSARRTVLNSRDLILKKTPGREFPTPFGRVEIDFYTFVFQ